jgi:SPP1 gp7 family putative phage head morphogenesis protein
MPVPFKLNPHQSRVRSRDLQTKERIVQSSVKAMDEILTGAVEDVVAHYQKTGRYKDPDLDRMYEVTEAFYRQVAQAAVTSCKRANPKKKLAAPPDGDLPSGPRALDRVLTDRKYWQRIMKRSRALTGRAKQAYLDRLRKQFKRIMPLLEIGDLTPRAIKKKLAEAWKAPRARAETIFRTESTKYFASAQVKFFEDAPYVIGFLFDSVRDNSRTPICHSRHGLIYRPGTDLLDKNTPALHYNCRSHLIPLVNDPQNMKMLADPKRDPEKVKVVPLPRGWKS